MRFSNKVLQHLLGDREIGDNTVFQGPNCGDIPRGTAQHVLGLHADRLDNTAASPGVFTNSYNRRLIEHDAMPSGVNQGVGRAKVNGQVI
jgi:hypothetical protein